MRRTLLGPQPRLQASAVLSKTAKGLARESNALASAEEIKIRSAQAMLLRPAGKRSTSPRETKIPAILARELIKRQSSPQPADLLVQEDKDERQNADTQGPRGRPATQGSGANQMKSPAKAQMKSAEKCQKS